MKPELNLLAAVFIEIESKYRAVKKQMEIIADKLVEKGVTPEDKRITENLNSGDEIKPRYLQTFGKTRLTKKEFSTLRSASQNTSENTAILEAVAGAVKTMAENMASKPHARFT